MLDPASRKKNPEVMRQAQRGITHAVAFAVALSALIACKKKEEKADAPVPATTTVTAADLKLRISPNTTAVELARLTRGEQVKIVQRSADSVQIGKMNAYWYKITTSSGLTGWAYGTGLAVESDEGSDRESDQRAIKKLREVLTGRWEAATVQGALVPNFITLYADGKVAFSTEKGKTQSGKYQLTFDGPTININIVDIKKPMMTDIKAKMIGETLVFTAMMEGTEYKLTLDEKGAGELMADEQPPAPAAPKP